MRDYVSYSVSIRVRLAGINPMEMGSVRWNLNQFLIYLSICYKQLPTLIKPQYFNQFCCQMNFF